MDKPDLKIHKLSSKAEHPAIPGLPDGQTEDQPSVRYVVVPGYGPDYAGPYTEDDSIDLLALWRVVAQYKRVLLSVFLLGILLAIGFAFLSTPVYRAELVMVSSIEEESGGLSSLAGQFGGLASLAGVNLGGAGNDVDRVLATLKSRVFLVPFLQQEKIMPLFARGPGSETLSVLDVYKTFTEDVLDIRKDNKTGLMTLGVEWHDPALAAHWANTLVARLNEHQRQAAIKEAQQSIDYLNQQLSKTSVVDMQQAIYRLIESQTRAIMLANVKKEYVMQVIDPALAPEKRVRPQRGLIVVLGAVLSIMAGIFIIFLLHGLKTFRQQLAQSDAA
ncbi:MAG: Wzz/FepE/Etk N-terminal domain-containing protein [Gammaproteobacteria bacterium]|nr:Wzz/FepE/Etk N-terminal domain-containing protein [Gammaproteobacteria bacterium]